MYKFYSVCLLPLLMALCFMHASLAAELKKYNYTVSDTHGFVWFRIAKVGTTSIYKILRDHRVPLEVNGFHSPYDPKLHKNYFKFAFVRNPWARVVSCYCNKIKNQCWPPFQECYGKDFNYFVDFICKHDLTKADRHIRLQTAMFPNKNMDFIGRLENFDQDLNYVLKRIGLVGVRIPKTNTSRHGHYSSYYNERTKKLITEKYKADIQAFGYQFETEGPQADSNDKI